MRIAELKFGQTHAVTAVGDEFKGKQEIDLACNPGYELSSENKHRWKLREGTTEDVACYKCRFKLGLDQEDDNGN